MPGFRIDPSSSFKLLKRKLDTAVRDIKKRQMLSIRRAALILEKALKQGIRDSAPGGQRFKPLALSTILQKGSSKPLIDTGSFWGSIKSTFNDASMTAFVGVNRSATGPGGASMYNLAVIHEYGTDPYAIPVTDGIRRLFVRLSILSDGAIKPLRDDTMFIMHPGVPARPFFKPTLAAVRPRLEQEVKITLEQNPL